jgi:DNA mismatch repair ATPase MutS
MTKKKAKGFQNILDKLNINESLTKPVKKEKVFYKVKDQVTLKEDYNFMADLVFLSSAKEGHKYALTVVDLSTDEFDIEAISDKQSTTILAAMKRIFKRQYQNQFWKRVFREQVQRLDV